MKALLKLVLQRERKQGMVVKWQVFLLLYHLIKRFAIASITRNLVVNYLLNLQQNNFLEIFKGSCNLTGNVIVQDGDPSQNSKAAKTTLDKVGAAQFSIFPRVRILIISKMLSIQWRKKISSDAVKYSISKESYAKFVERTENTVLSYPSEPIDNTIESMPKTMSHVIQ